MHLTMVDPLRFNGVLPSFERAIIKIRDLSTAELSQAPPYSSFHHG